MLCELISFLYLQLVCQDLDTELKLSKVKVIHYLKTKVLNLQIAFTLIFKLASELLFLSNRLELSYRDSNLFQDDNAAVYKARS